MSKKAVNIGLTLFLILTFFSSSFSQEESVTIITYYPPPHGSYNKLQTNKMAVGDTNEDEKFDSLDQPANNGELKAISIIQTGGPVFPLCSFANRGQTFLLRGGAGVEDGFCICKKKADGSYGWIALGSPDVVTLAENLRITFSSSSSACLW